MPGPLSSAKRSDHRAIPSCRLAQLQALGDGSPMFA